MTLFSVTEEATNRFTKSCKPIDQEGSRKGSERNGSAETTDVKRNGPLESIVRMLKPFEKKLTK